jgi:hypothetical protein
MVDNTIPSITFEPLSTSEDNLDCFKVSNSKSLQYLTILQHKLMCCNNYVNYYKSNKLLNPLNAGNLGRSFIPTSIYRILAKVPK